MSSRGDLFFCAIFILSSIMLMATTSSLSINFKVYAQIIVMRHRLARMSIMVFQMF